MRAFRPTAVCVVALALMVFVAACGSSNSAATNTHHAPATVTKTVTRPASTGTTASTSTTTTTTTAGIPECTVADLSPTLLNSNGAAGTLVLTFALKNIGTKECFTFGWPGIGFLNSSGGLLPTTPSRVTSDVLGPVKASTINLTPAAEASFRVVNHDVGSKCAQAATIEITPPNDTANLKLALTPGLTVCNNATVTPLQPGTAALPSGT